MGKVSPVSAKYIITTDISIEGTVDRPDVIGAIFGQTEGFLGSDLELRELQRSGKVGRIEVKLDVVSGKSSGKIVIPSSLDKAETAIIAAALETIERIGPCNSRVKVKSIEDVRISKRDFVVTRAKELLRNLQANVLPDSQEITDEVAQSVRMMEITTWGPERLPAGPAVSESEEIILVEGRADVLNLLKMGIKNAIALNGTSVPASVKKLCKEKVVTVFVDGDRGGDLIIRELMSTSDLDYVTKAPDGKEVEELAKKEIHLALRAKIASAQYKLEASSSPSRRPSPSDKRSPRSGSRTTSRSNGRSSPREFVRKPDVKDLGNFKEMLFDLIGTRGAFILDSECKILGKVPTSELEGTLKELQNVHAVVFDGQVTKEIAKAAEGGNVNYVVATDSKIRPSDTKVRIVTQKELA